MIVAQTLAEYNGLSRFLAGVSIFLAKLGDDFRSADPMLQVGVGVGAVVLWYMLRKKRQP